MAKEICAYCGQRQVNCTVDNGVKVYTCQKCGATWNERAPARHDHNPGKDRERAERSKDRRP